MFFSQLFLRTLDAISGTIPVKSFKTTLWTVGTMNMPVNSHPAPSSRIFESKIAALCLIYINLAKIIK